MNALRLLLCCIASSAALHAGALHPLRASQTRLTTVQPALKPHLRLPQRAPTPWAAATAMPVPDEPQVRNAHRSSRFTVFASLHLTTHLLVSQGLAAKLRAKLPPADEMRKIVPLAIMFFCILFNYTILRDTKDVLVVTAPGGSAEAIPFLKTWVNLPGAILFTVAYSALANRLGRQALFYTTLAPFLAFFGAFPWIYQMRDILHPVGFAAYLSAMLPAGFAAPIAVFRNWTYSLFYFLANMWGSVVVSLLFWGQHPPSPRARGSSQPPAARTDACLRAFPRRPPACIGRSGGSPLLAPLLATHLRLCKRGDHGQRGEEVLPALRHVRQRGAYLLRPVRPLRLLAAHHPPGGR